jgi:hypothetical protein
VLKFSVFKQGSELHRLASGCETPCWQKKLTPRHLQIGYKTREISNFGKLYTFVLFVPATNRAAGKLPVRDFRKETA